MEQSVLARNRINDLDLWLWGTGNAQRAYLTFGCHYIPELDAHRFVVWAPNAQAVTIVGDWNGWDETTCPMERIEGGYWAALIPQLHDGMAYKYCITTSWGERIQKADPFAFHAETGPATASKIWSLDGYAWNDEAFLDARRERDILNAPMSIYEVHLGSWRKKPGEVFPNYRAIADELCAYCLDMGYTHVEFMPLTEYPFEGSWGYQVTGFYAPTSRYGTPQDFMAMVDKLHQAGIGVIMDWVPAHFPKDAHGLALFDGTPLFEYPDPRMGEHPDWGTLVFNFDSPQVRSFLISSAMFFFDAYHIDGIRVDAVSSMLYLDYGRGWGQWVPNRDGGNINYGAADFLRQLNRTVLTAYPGVATIAEESTSFPMVSRPPEMGGLGFMFKWDMGYMHDTLEYMAKDPIYRKYEHHKIIFSMHYAFTENFILSYSHDEVVHGKGSMINKMWGDYDIKFAALRALWGFTFAHPGKKLMFMGGELAQFTEWDYRKELDWMLLDFPKHRGMQDYVRQLNRLYTATPALWQQDCGWDGFTWLNVDDGERSAIAFLRTGRDGSKLVCACNFTPMRCDGFPISLPAPGTLHEVLSSDEGRFGGWGTKNDDIRAEQAPFRDMPCSARITLPPMSAVWFSFEEDSNEA